MVAVAWRSHWMSFGLMHWEMVHMHLRNNRISDFVYKIRKKNVCENCQECQFKVIVKVQLFYELISLLLIWFWLNWL